MRSMSNPKANKRPCPVNHHQYLFNLLKACAACCGVRIMAAGAAARRAFIISAHADIVEAKLSAAHPLLRAAGARGNRRAPASMATSSA